MLVALGACLAAVIGWRYARASAPVTGPILVISIDALRADHLAAYGYRSGKTPAIDSLAADGIVFERAYSHVPQTLPAHAALLTGRLPFENGVRDGVGFTLNSNERLLAEMLRDRGYATGGVVSSFLLRKESGIGQGFGFFDAAWPAGADGAPVLQREGIESERVAERWLDSAGTTRAFLFLHLAEPSIEAASSGSAGAVGYDQRVTRADEIVGRLVSYLKAHQLYDQSTLMLLADHGQGLGDHGEQEHGLLLYDEVLRVPLIVKQAAGAAAGLRVLTPVQHIDVVPTILDLAKAPIPGNLRGRSLTPLFNKGGHLDDRLLYAESLFGQYHFGWSPLTSVTDGRYRYISATTPELYDLRDDPASRHNLVDTRADMASQFQRALAAMTPTEPAETMEAVRAGDREPFETLGYVGTWDGALAGAPRTNASPINPQIVERYRAAVRLLAARQWTPAIEAFRALTLAAPDSADAWTQLARASRRAEHHDVAERAYARVIALAPAAADGYLGAAESWLLASKFEAARVQAQKVVEATIGDAHAQATAHELLARAALGRRRFDTARAEATRAEEADAERPVVTYVNGRIALEQRRYTEAMEAFAQALAVVDAHHGEPLADLRLYAAESFAQADRSSEAEYLFLEQLKESPLSPRALAGLTTLYRASGRTDEAAALSRH